MPSPNDPPPSFSLPARRRRRIVGARCGWLVAVVLAAMLATASLSRPAPTVAPAQASAAPRLLVGIADQRAANLGDARLTELPVRHARLSVAWDAMRYRWQRAEIDAWMAAAEAAGMVPLVTFGGSRTRDFSLPSTAAYARAVRAFRRRYRDVREFSPWNEPNLARSPVNSDPRRIASYYNTLRSQCPRCTVLGADLVDTASLEPWMRAYLRVFAPGRRPRRWGLHNYVDANSRSSWGTRTMLRVAPGEIWFNEVGALVRRPTPRRAQDRRALMRIGKRRSAATMRRVFALAAISRRIKRVYVYHWKASRRAVWDSALVSPRGTPRPSFHVFASHARRSAAADQDRSSADTDGPR